MEERVVNTKINFDDIFEVQLAAGIQAAQGIILF